MCGLCIEAETLGCVVDGQLQLELAKDLFGESSNAFIEQHCLTELARGELEESDILFSEYPLSETIVWSILHHNQFHAFSTAKLKNVSDILESKIPKELTIINEELSVTLPNLFSLMRDLPVNAGGKIDGIFKALRMRDDLDLIVSDAESFLKTLCGNFISLTQRVDIVTFTQSDNGISDEQVDSIFTSCPISIFLAKWLLERLAPNHIVHDLIPVVNSPVPCFDSYVMAWRRHATLWLLHNRSEQQFLHLLPNMYPESLFYLKKMVSMPSQISKAIDKRLVSEFPSC